MVGGDIKHELTVQNYKTPDFKILITKNKESANITNGRIRTLKI